MRIGYVGMDERGNEIIKVNKTYIYFNAFDDEKFADHLNMRFCQVKKVWSRVLYSRCDTVPKTAGAGVYLRMRNKNTGRVERKVCKLYKSYNLQVKITAGNMSAAYYSYYYARYL